MTIKEKFENIINKLFEAEIQTELSGATETPAQQETPQPETKLEGFTLIDGTSIDITEDVVSLVAEDGSLSPAPDGMHMLSDGSVITVASGKLTGKMEVADVLSTLASGSQLKSELSKANATVAEHETQLNSILEKLQKLEAQPADKKIVAKPANEPEKLSKAQLSLKIARELAQ